MSAKSPANVSDKEGAVLGPPVEEGEWGELGGHSELQLRRRCEYLEFASSIIGVYERLQPAYLFAVLPKPKNTCLRAPTPAPLSSPLLIPWFVYALK